MSYDLADEEEREAVRRLASRCACGKTKKEAGCFIVTGSTVRCPACWDAYMDARGFTKRKEEGT